jgi:uncharacterized protein (TIGR03083 family)
VSLSREELIGVAQAERQRLGRTIQYVPPESWEQPSACPGWWNRDVVAHMGGQDTAAAHLFRGDPAEELDAYRATLPSDEAFTVDGLNAFLVNNRSGLPYREVLTTWGLAAEGTLDYAAALSDDAWRDERFPWLLGAIAARYLVQSRVVEWWVHGEDIRATTGLGPQIQHWPIFLTIDMGVRMLPWTLGEAGIDLQGARVKIDLDGAGVGWWHWGLGAGDAPPPDKKPDAFIQGRAAQFALVAAHRLPVEDVLDSGNVVLGGEADIAETVVRHIRAYP